MRSIVVAAGALIIAANVQAAGLTFPTLPSVTHYVSVADREVTVTGEEVTTEHVTLMYAKPERTSAVLARLSKGTSLTTDGEVRGQYTRVFRGNMMGWVQTNLIQ
jgi:hypothetical protein